MGSLATTCVLALLAAVIVAALSGFFACRVARRNARLARGRLALGFCCGVLPGVILRRRSQRLTALNVISRIRSSRQLMPGLVSLALWRTRPGRARAVPCVVSASARSD